MVDEITPAGTVAPAATTATVATTTQAAAPPVALPPPVEGDPTWLPARLERERKAFLEQLGVTNVEDVKKSLADFKAKQEADKTEAQRNAERLSELDRVKADLADVRATNKARAEREMALLDADQRAAVIGIAGEDSNAQLKVIDKLAPTWAKAAAAKTTDATTTTKTEATTQQVATTAPPKSAPPDTTQTQLSPKETYARLKTTNPIQAAHYLNQHAKEIYPSA